MDTQLSLSRGILSRRYELEFNLTLRLQEHQLTLIVDRVLHSVIHDDIIQGNALINWKGRDPELLLLGDTPSNLRPKGEELLFFEGESRSQEVAGPDNFQISVGTEFVDFPSRTEIQHRILREQKGSCPKEISIQDLAWVLSLRLRRFRFGIDRFSRNFVASMLGVVPTVTETILLDCYGEQLALRVLSGHSRQREIEPFQESGIFRELCEILSEASGSNIYDAFLEARNAA